MILKLNKIDYLIDVRFVPFSKYVSHFNKENLNSSLKEEDIQYSYMGNQLGIDKTNKLNFNPLEQFIDYSLIAKSRVFQKGLDAIINVVEQGYSIALMCSEKDPLDCHRAILISRELKKRGISVNHIIDMDTANESHNHLEERLLALYNKQNNAEQIELFSPAEITLDEAYRLQNISISHLVKKNGD